MSFRDDVLAALDFDRFYRSQTEIGAKVGPDEYRIRCPFHEDREPSANVNMRKGLWSCHTEGIGGGPIDWLMRRESIDVKTALDRLAEFAGVSKTKPATSAPVRRSRLPGEDKIAAWHEAALRNTELMAWFTDKRGYTPETVATWQLGWDGERVTIPVRSPDGELLNVRRYLRNAASVAMKMIGVVGHNDARLWPEPPPEGDVLLVEGEWDTILMRQQGFPEAMTATGGAGTWKPEWNEAFQGRLVTIAYDNDETGRRGAQKVALQLAPFSAGVRILTIPGLPDKGDPTDFFVEQSRTADELRQLILDATPFVTGATKAPAGPPVAVPLYAASDARYHGVPLETAVLLSGKAMTPYTVPFRFTASCGMNNKRFCGICPMQAVGGLRNVTLTAAEPAVLSLVNVSDEARYKALKILAEAVPACNLVNIDVDEHVNVEELRLIPELDAAAAGDTEYVARQGFFIGHGLAPNRGYLMRGYAHPHPKTQATVHLLSEAVPAQDNISAFELTEQLTNDLRQFNSDGDDAVAVDQRWRDIYGDFAGTVHRIQDRFDMQVAYDLAWHSVIAFNFNGAYVRRGWVEGMVMSDSGQGKTEMAMNLLRHYRLGERVQAEQSSSAGLIGGLEKMGDTWLLSWGRIPLNDKRLIVVDETQGLASSAIEGLSDVRATGIAEITKIRTERTNARCRILWLANPVSGLTLSQHNQGVLAIKELFKKPEDIRRLDFALCLASGDVDYARAINVHHDAAASPRYSSDLSRSLILWAWSRRPEQVVFSQDATDRILAAATEQGRKYHASIPLVEPSDQRLKLARLAAAAAARMYSVDESGQQLVVRLGHVEFIVAYLDRIYNARAMAYGEYSDQQRRGESVEPDEAREIRDAIAAWERGANAIEFLRQARIFKKSELEDVVGWDSDYVKAQLRFLASHRLIRPTREGFVKTPAFITLLRSLTLSETVAADLREALEGAEF